MPFFERRKTGKERFRSGDREKRLYLQYNFESKEFEICGAIQLAIRKR